MAQKLFELETFSSIRVKLATDIDDSDGLLLIPLSFGFLSLFFFLSQTIIRYLPLFRSGYDDTADHGWHTRLNKVCVIWRFCLWFWSNRYFLLEVPRVQHALYLVIEGYTSALLAKPSRDIRLWVENVSKSARGNCCLPVLLLRAWRYYIKSQAQ